MAGVDEFCTRDSNHEGVEIFDFEKQKFDTPIRTHRLDTIHFSRPRLAKRVTRARATTLPTIVEELETSTKQVKPLPPVRTNICRITTVQESTVNEKTWHIACILKTSAKAY